MRQFIAVFGALLALAAARPAGATPLVYDFDQRYGSISFAVDVLGMFTANGDFRRFMGTLDLDPARPEATRIDVTIDANSVAMDSDDAVTMLRSPDYFDPAHYPRIRFQSTRVETAGEGSYRLSGVLSVRDARHDQTLDVSMVGRHTDASGQEIADVVATGALDRSAFGMLADRPLIDDKVRLKILMRVVLRRAGAGG